MGAVGAGRDAGKADVAEEGPYRVWFSVLARGVHDWYAAATGANHGRLRRALRIERGSLLIGGLISTGGGFAGFAAFVFTYSRKKRTVEIWT